MTMLKITLCVFISSILIFARAQDSPTRSAPGEMRIVHLIHVADRNGDRVTSHEEWQAQLDQLEEAGGGQITNEVIREFLEANRPEKQDSSRKQKQEKRHVGDRKPPKVDRDILEEQFSQWDDNGDGIVTHNDLPKPGKRPKRSK